MAKSKKTLQKEAEIVRLVEASQKLFKFKEGSNRYPEKYRLEYDVMFINDYKKKNPKKIQKIKDDLIKKEFWLKYNHKLLERKLNEVILPPLLKNELTPTGTQASLEFDVLVYPIHKKKDVLPIISEVKYKVLDTYLAKLDPIDKKIIEMKFGLPPHYDREYKYVEIAREVGINNAVLSKKIKKLLEKLKVDMKHDMENLEEDPNFDEEAYRNFEGYYGN